MKKWIQLSVLGVSCILALGACSNLQTKAVETSVTHADLNAYERWVLKTGTWVTHSITDVNGRMHSGRDPAISHLAGVTRFYDNGTFRSVTMNTAKTYEGNWSISDDGKILTLTGVGVEGRVGFRVQGEVTNLNDVNFEYRVYPNASQPKQFMDVKLGPASIDDTRILSRQASVNPNSFSSIAN